MLGLQTLVELEQLERLRHETKLKGPALDIAYHERYDNKYGVGNPEPGMYDAIKGGPVHKVYQLKGASEVKVRGWHEDVINIYKDQLDNFEITEEEYLELTHPSHEYLAGR